MDTGEIESVTLSDTTQKAREVYFQRLKEMTPSERLSLAVALWEAGDSVQRAAARRLNAHANKVEIAFQLAVTRFGLAVARKAYSKT